MTLRSRNVSPSESVTAGRSSDLLVFLWPVLTSLLIGAITVGLSAHPPRWLEFVPQKISRVIGGIAEIARHSRNPRGTTLIMGWQWAFLPWYVAIWFGRFAPWRTKIRAATRAKASSLRPRQRILVVVGLLFFSAYILGDLALIPFPTLVNSRWAYPATTADPLLLPIYKSSVFLMFYGWVSPFCETTLWWMFFSMAINVSYYLGIHRSEWPQRD